ncbi:Uncharacterised protein [Serratia fonticola]|uniref:Uncharacterized protein n=1 Tax=Serratia fonticola TaxID=47917 RepID=A0A4U9WFR4_SERFO|nr:Uncharacterised protein [Serratia fonticola]
MTPGTYEVELFTNGVFVERSKIRFVLGDDRHVLPVLSSNSWSALALRKCLWRLRKAACNLDAILKIFRFRPICHS